MNGAILTYANKIDINYILYYKSNVGYHKLLASINNGVINIGNLTLTNYKITDFTNCQMLLPNGVCSSCGAD